MTAAQGSVLVLVAVMILYATEVIPLAVTAMGSCAVLAILQIAPATVIWSGLASDTTLVVGGMVVIGITLIETGVAKALGDWILKTFHGKPEIAACGVIATATLLSAFMNNSASVATMLPVMAGVVLSSNGKLHEKHFMLPMATATNVGGMLTLIGTTSQMIVQDALMKHGFTPFSFFEFAWLGIPMCVAFILYFKTAGKWIGKRLWKIDAPHSEMVAYFRESAQSEGSPNNTVGLGKHQIIAVCILLGSVTCMIFSKHITNGTIAMTGAAFCVITRCISIKQVYKKFDWTTVFVLAGGIGFANGLDKCGGGKLVADWMVGLLGDSLSPTTIFVVFVITGTVLTQFMSNTAVAAMLTPIAIPFITIVGINPAAILMGICASTNLSFSTPIATPSMTLVLGPGNYKFSDYAKWCGGFNVICTMMILLIVPLVWPLT